MFSSCRLKAVVLVLAVGVLVLGFMLTSDFVQEAPASDSDCDKAWDDYAQASLYAHVICAGYGSNSPECGGAWLRAAYYFLRAVVICAN